MVYFLILMFNGVNPLLGATQMRTLYLVIHPFPSGKENAQEGRHRPTKRILLYEKICIVIRACAAVKLFPASRLNMHHV
jgi:hypothetical protein